MRVVIEPVVAAHLAEISTLADVIWRAHYPGIISPEQIDYMLARVYDIDTMRRELENGVAWFRALVDGELLGFAAVCPTDSTTEYKLHKLYVHLDWQRRGLGSALLENCESIARTHGATTLILNVNKRNTVALAAYRQHGFVIRKSIVADIGGGFVMDDYVMVKNIAR